MSELGYNAPENLSGINNSDYAAYPSWIGERMNEKPEHYDVAEMNEMLNISGG